MNMHIIVTGGTFDKEYNELDGEKQISINIRNYISSSTE